MMAKDAYTVGWICALSLELAASIAMLDEELPTPDDIDASDDNVYSTGLIGRHHVVMACLPAGKMGKASAAVVAQNMLRSYPSIRFGLMVGIGGAVPDFVDVRLGDVVVSKPTANHGGVVQYDMGKVGPLQFEVRGHLNKPPPVLLNALNKLQAVHETKDPKVPEHIAVALEASPKMRSQYRYPGAEKDVLYEANCVHGIELGCPTCGPPKHLQREQRRNWAEDVDTDPRIFYGIIGSGDRVMASARERKLLAQDAGIICFEMEAAGLMDTFPCVVIRGISDYADVHKHDDWKRYAAISSAAFAKELLEHIPATKVHDTKKAADLVTGVHGGTVLQGDVSRVMLNSMTATADTEYTGDYNIINPVSSYVPRLALFRSLELYLHETIHLKESRCVVVHGLGGAGKSQLMRDYVKRYGEDYRARLWVSADSQTSIDGDFRHIYKLLHQHVSQSQAAQLNSDDIAVAVRSWFNGRDGKWLLVFDSADDIAGEDDDNPQEQYIDIMKYVPQSSNMHIVITTRNTLVKDMPDALSIEVDQLEENEALEIFNKCAKLSVPQYQTNTDIIKDFLKELGYIALAIALAGTYVSQTPDLKHDLPRYFEEYHQNKKILLEQRPKKLVHQYRASILVAWETSVKAIRARSEAAARFLAILACLDPADISTDLFYDLGSDVGEADLWQDFVAPAVSIDVHDVRRFFHLLCEYSLLQWKDEARSYSMHKLVHAWSIERLAEEERRRASFAVLELIAFSCDNPRDFPTKLRIAKHTVANQLVVGKVFDETYVKDNASTGETYLTLMMYFYRVVGLFLCDLEDAHAIQALKLGVTISAAINGEDHQDTFKARIDLARTLAILGQNEEALLMYEDVYKCCLHALGVEHPQTTLSKSELASMYADRSRYAEAKSLQREVLAMRLSQVVEQHPDAIEAQNGLAFILEVQYDLEKDQSKLEEAIEIRSKTLEQQKHALGENHEDVIANMRGLSDALHKQGRCAESLSMRQHCLAYYQHRYGEDTLETLKALQYMAQSLKYTEKLDEAVSMERKLVEKYTKLYGEANSITIESIGCLATSLDLQGNLNEAMLLRQKAYERVHGTFSEGSAPTLNLMITLSRDLFRQQRFDEAAVISEELLDKGKKLRGEEHPVCFREMEFLATVFGKQKRYEKLIHLLDELIELRQRINGINHLTTLESTHNKALALSKAGSDISNDNLAEAERVERDVLERAQNNLGENHEFITNVEACLVSIWAAQGKSEEAIRLERYVSFEKLR